MSIGFTQPKQKEKKKRFATKNLNALEIFLVIIVVFIFIVGFNIAMQDTEQEIKEKKAQSEINNKKLKVLERYIKKNEMTGFIKRFDTNLNQVYINHLTWRSINFQAKKRFASYLVKYLETKGYARIITIKDNMSGKKLGYYNDLIGFKVY